jgi:hypothetical protein
MSKLYTDLDSFSICATIIILSCITAVTVYNVHENILKSQNMESAITKGIDPLSVRCSYANPQDLICVSYSSRK